MIDIVLQLIRLSLPLFFTVLLLIIFYLICVLAFEQQKWWTELFFFSVLILIIPDILEMLDVVKEITSLITSILFSLIPVISAILLILQGIVAFFTWNPFVLIIIQWIVFLVDKLFLPALLVSILLDIWSRGIPSISFSKAAQFIRTSLLVAIGSLMLTLTLMFTISTTVIISLNETVSTPLKRMLEQSIPIVGSVIVQVFSLIKKSQVVTSSALGATTIMVMLLILATPLLFFIIKAMMYRLLAIICEPFMPSAITGLFEDISKSLFLLCGIVAIMFSSIVFIILMILLCSYFVMGSV